jgi:hypothetical protein
MNPLLLVMLILLAAVIGFMIGDIGSCSRGGCLMHGKDFKCRARR